MSDQSRTYRYSRNLRLCGRNAFDGVFAARVRRNVGQIACIGKPNEKEHCRFGVSVGKRVGNAPTRNRIKRLLREAFRLSQHDWPVGYDIVCVVYPHQPLTMAEYQRLLFSAIRGMHHTRQRRMKSRAGKSDSE